MLFCYFQNPLLLFSRMIFPTKDDINHKKRLSKARCSPYPLLSLPPPPNTGSSQKYFSILEIKNSVLNLYLSCNSSDFHCLVLPFIGSTCVSTPANAVYTVTVRFNKQFLSRAPSHVKEMFLVLVWDTASSMCSVLTEHSRGQQKGVSVVSVNLGW